MKKRKNSWKSSPYLFCSAVLFYEWIWMYFPIWNQLMHICEQKKIDSRRFPFHSLIRRCSLYLVFFFYLSCFGGHVIWSKSYWRELQKNYLINLFWHSLMFIKIFYIYNYNYCTVKYKNIGFTSTHLPLWEFRLFWRILWHL